MFDVQDLASESSLESQRNRKRAVKLISIVIATFAGAFFYYNICMVFNQQKNRLCKFSQVQKTCNHRNIDCRGILNSPKYIYILRLKFKLDFQLKWKQTNFGGQNILRSFEHVAIHFSIPSFQRNCNCCFTNNIVIFRFMAANTGETDKFSSIRETPHRKGWKKDNKYEYI